MKFWFLLAFLCLSSVLLAEDRMGIYLGGSFSYRVLPEHIDCDSKNPWGYDLGVFYVFDHFKRVSKAFEFGVYRFYSFNIGVSYHRLYGYTLGGGGIYPFFVYKDLFRLYVSGIMGGILYRMTFDYDGYNNSVYFFHIFLKGGLLGKYKIKDNIGVFMRFWLLSPVVRDFPPVTLGFDFGGEYAF